MSRAAEPELATSEDAFLGGRLMIRQPKTGYRAGIDAVLLAAACPAVFGQSDRVLDCGAGVGTVGLCVAARVVDTQVTLLEREPPLADLARDNAERNGLADRVDVVTGDIAARDRAAEAPGLKAESFDHVLANPPFHTTGDGTSATDALKSASHEMPDGTLDDWARFAARMAKPGGTFTIIHKADALEDVLAAVSRRFGGLKILALHPRAGEPAIRVIVQGIKGSRAPLTILAGHVLHEDGHAFTPLTASILKDGAGLSLR